VLVALIYVAIGWVALAAFPQLLDKLGVTATAMVAAGGLLYNGRRVSSTSAKRPDPSPTVFGYTQLRSSTRLVDPGGRAPVRGRRVLGAAGKLTGLRHLMVVAALAGGGAPSLGVSACGSSSNRQQERVVGRRIGTDSDHGSRDAAQADDDQVTVNGSTPSRSGCPSWLRLPARANPRTCAAIKSSQLKLLTQNQKNAVKAAAGEGHRPTRPRLTARPRRRHPSRSPPRRPRPAAIDGGGTTTG